MARMNDWQREIHEGTRRENWTLRGPNRVVKVVPLGGSPQNALGGFITVGSALLGKTPSQIEQALGLKRNYLDKAPEYIDLSGCRWLLNTNIYPAARRFTSGGSKAGCRFLATR
jgi:hypothetical protein